MSVWASWKMDSLFSHMASFHNPDSLFLMFIHCMFRRTFGLNSRFRTSSIFLPYVILNYKKSPLYRITSLINSANLGKLKAAVVEADCECESQGLMCCILTYPVFSVHSYCYLAFDHHTQLLLFSCVIWLLKDKAFCCSLPPLSSLSFYLQRYLVQAFGWFSSLHS